MAEQDDRRRAVSWFTVSWFARWALADAVVGYEFISTVTPRSSPGSSRSWPGCRIDASAFVGKVSGSHPGCP
jgi:hypothetical protein